jgi:hypothetical protein
MAWLRVAGVLPACSAGKLTGEVRYANVGGDVVWCAKQSGELVRVAREQRGECRGDACLRVRTEGYVEGYVCSRPSKGREECGERRGNVCLRVCTAIVGRRERDEVGRVVLGEGEEGRDCEQARRVRQGSRGRRAVQCIAACSERARGRAPWYVPGGDWAMAASTSCG